MYRDRVEVDLRKTFGVRFARHEDSRVWGGCRVMFLVWEIEENWDVKLCVVFFVFCFLFFVFCIV